LVSSELSPHFSQALIFSTSGVCGGGVGVFAFAGIGFEGFLSTGVILFCLAGWIFGMAPPG
jgi:hypothetical protein